MRTAVLLFLLIVLHCAAIAQKQKTDSLLQLIKADKEDTVKINHLNDLAYLYRNSKPDSTILLCEQSIALCEKLAQTSNLKLWTGYSNAIGNMAIGYRLSGNFVKAKEYYFKALAMDEKLGYKFGIGKRLVGITNVFDNLGDYPKALEYGFKALKVNEEINNPRAIALSNSVIGNIYFDQKEYEKAMKYSLIAIRAFEKIGDLNNVVASTGKLGLMFSQQQNYTKALQYMNDALRLANHNGLEQIAAETLNDMGYVYLQQKNYDQALAYYLKGLEKDKELSINTGISNEYNYIGYVYMMKHDYPKAEQYLLDAIKTGLEVRALKNQLQAQNNLAELYQLWNKPAQALAHFKLASLLKDSIFNQNNTQRIMNIEYEKKELEQRAEQDKKDTLAAAERKKQQLILFFVALGLVSVLIFAIYVVNSLKERNKQNKIIEAQKKKVEQKQTEILDSIAYALRIQTAILPSPRTVAQHLKDSFILYKPKDIVAGDFYWMEAPSNSPKGGEQIRLTHTEDKAFPLSPLGRDGVGLGDWDGIVLFAACDCTGHGVPGAMVSVVCHNALNRAVREFGLINPAAILDKTAELVIENFAKSEDEIQDGMDISICALNTKTRTLEWAGAYNPLILIHNGELIETKADKQCIGLNVGVKPFTNHQFTLQPNTGIYLFTDGFADQFGGEPERKVTKRKFKELLLSIQNASIQEQGVLLENYITDFRKDIPQTDDILVIGVRA